jgi:hypothetical protein
VGTLASPRARRLAHHRRPPPHRVGTLASPRARRLAHHRRPPPHRVGTLASPRARRLAHHRRPRLIAWGRLRRPVLAALHIIAVPASSRGDACVALRPVQELVLRLTWLNNEEECDGELVVPVQLDFPLQGLQVLHLDIPAYRVFNGDGI